MKVSSDFMKTHLFVCQYKKKHGCANGGCQARGDMEINDQDWQRYKISLGVTAIDDETISYKCDSGPKNGAILKRVPLEDVGRCASIW